jgi:hypothetical protein
MTDGAGPGPGLKGDGSQNAAEGASTGDAEPGSGAVAGLSSGNGKDENAAGRAVGGVEKAPFVVAGLVVVLSLTGTLLL